MVPQFDKTQYNLLAFSRQLLFLSEHNERVKREKLNLLANSASLGNFDRIYQTKYFYISASLCCVQCDSRSQPLN